MAKFSLEEAAAVAAIQQVINDWARELDINNGLGMGPFVTADCEYHVRGAPRFGRDAVVSFYTERLKEFDGVAGGVPVLRHSHTNFRTMFKAADHAACEFLLLYFHGTGDLPVKSQAMPLAVADVQMECRRDATGEWRISYFNSYQSFVFG